MLLLHSMSGLENIVTHAIFPFGLVFNQDHPQYDEGDDSGIALQEAKPQLKAPSMYRVVMFNDDYTPMDFVVEVLQSIFGHDREKATQLMLTVHTEGKAVCGIFTRDVAETKAMQANEYARECQHPLLCEIERNS